MAEKSGIRSSPAIRSTESNRKRSCPSFVSWLVIVTTLPSARTPLALIIQASSSGELHKLSVYPPSESNTHDLICLLSGSRPIRCVPDSTFRPLTRTVKSLSKKVLLASQRYEDSTRESGPSSIQSPTSH